MAAPSFESKSTLNQAATSSTATLSRPSGVVSGRLMVAILGWSNRTLSSAPSGWAQEYLDDSTYVVPRLGVWWKLAGGSEPSDYSWTFSGTVNLVGAILHYSHPGGFDADPVDDLDAATTTSGTSYNSPTSTTTGADRLIIRAAAYQANRTITFPSGLTPAQYDDKVGTSSANPGLGIALEAAQASAGSTASASWSWNATTNVNGATLAIFGAAGGASIVPLVVHHMRMQGMA